MYTNTQKTYTKIYINHIKEHYEENYFCSRCTDLLS